MSVTASKRSTISVEFTRDMVELNRLLNLPEIYEGVADDSCPPIGEVDLAKWLRVGFRAVLVRREGEVAGFFLVVDRKFGTWECHTNLLSQLTGAEKLAAARAMQDLLFIQPECVRLSSFVPACNRAAAVFAVRGGFTFDTEPAPDWVKRGVRYKSRHCGMDRLAWMRRKLETK